jgi:hypothetical protein
VLFAFLSKSYSTANWETFNELYRYSAGSARAINKAATHCLIYAAQRAKKLIDDAMVRTVIEAELP